MLNVIFHDIRSFSILRFRLLAILKVLQRTIYENRYRREIKVLHAPRKITGYFRNARGRAPPPHHFRSFVK